MLLILSFVLPQSTGIIESGLVSLLYRYLPRRRLVESLPRVIADVAEIQWLLADRLPPDLLSMVNWRKGICGVVEVDVYVDLINLRTIDVLE